MSEYIFHIPYDSPLKGNEREIANRLRIILGNVLEPMPPLNEGDKPRLAQMRNMIAPGYFTDSSGNIDYNRPVTPEIPNRFKISYDGLSNYVGELELRQAADGIEVVINFYGLWPLADKHAQESKADKIIEMVNSKKAFGLEGAVLSLEPENA